MEHATTAPDSSPLRSRDTLIADSQVPGVRPGLEAAEHRANVLRLQLVAPLASLLWALFIPLDFLHATYIEPGAFEHYLWPRLMVLPIGLYLSYRSRAVPMMTPVAFRRAEVMLFVAAAWAISTMCVLGFGVRSLYFAGIGTVIAARAATLSEHTRHGAPVYGAMILGHCAILYLPGWLQGTPSDLLPLALQAVLLASVATVCVIGSHAQWKIRRQVLARNAIGRYKLLEVVGAGGMGEVWRAQTSQLRRDVAVKLLPAGGETANALHRFEREAAMLSELGHPHTVRIFDYGVAADGTPYYAMELLDGENLSARIAQTGPLPPSEVSLLARQISGALAEAHRLGIVHRDVKPENVFLVNGLGRSLHAKLLDFGIASLGFD